MNHASCSTFHSLRIVSSRGVLHAVPHSPTVSTIDPSSHYPPLTSITPVLPNLSPIPNKYHFCIDPPLRRVYLGDGVNDSKAVINDLKSKIACLEARIETLKSDNESARRESCLLLDKAKEDARLVLNEAKREAQLALDKVKGDLQLANLSLKECRAEDNALKSRSAGNTSGHSAFNIPSKDTFPGNGGRTVKFLPKRVQFPPFGPATNDMRLISAAREALAVLSSSPTPPSVASAQSGSRTVSTGSNIPSHDTDQVTAATTSVAGECSTTSNTPILDRSTTPSLLYPPIHVFGHSAPQSFDTYFPCSSHTRAL